MTHQRVGGGRRRFAPGEKEALVEQARELRQAGVTAEDIATKLGVSQSSAQRWTVGVKKIRKPAITKVIAASKKAETRADRERNRIDTDDSDEPQAPFIRVTTMPTDVEDYQPYRDDETDEWIINPNLLAHANAVIQTKSMDEATGRLVTVTDPEWRKALIVAGHSSKIGEYDDFLIHRNHWRAARDFCEQNLDHIATKAGVSSASIVRYEKSTRSPDQNLWRTLHLAYRSMLDQHISEHEFMLTIYSYCDANDLSHDDQIDLEAVMDWYRTCDWEDITHLAYVRSLIPLPSWRDEKIDFDGYFTPELITS